MPAAITVVAEQAPEAVAEMVLVKGSEQEAVTEMAPEAEQVTVTAIIS